MQQQPIFIALLIGLVIFFSVIETFIPGQKNKAHRILHTLPNIVLMFLTFAIGFALNVEAVVFAAYIDIGQYALITLDLPFWLNLLLSIAVLDFFAYLAHRLMHMIPLLWRFHRVHHSDLLVDVTTSYRQHPIEGLWRFLFTILPSWALGISPEVIVIYKSLSALFAIMEHINIEIWMPADRLISKLLVTPNMHKLHHSRQQIETDSNYGNIIAIYDRVFRTFTPQKDLTVISYGLDRLDDPQHQNLPALLRLPFKKPS